MSPIQISIFSDGTYPITLDYGKEEYKEFATKHLIRERKYISSNGTYAIIQFTMERENINYLAALMVHNGG